MDFYDSENRKSVFYFSAASKIDNSNNYYMDRQAKIKPKSKCQRLKYITQAETTRNYLKPPSTLLFTRINMHY